MKRPYWLSIVGGPNALSIWTWLVSFAWTVSVTGVLDQLERGTFSVDWLGAVVVSQSIIGIAVWIAIAVALPKPGARPRPLVVLVILLALGALRAVTMQIGSDLTEYNDGFTMIDRLIFGFGYSLAFGVLVALVVDGARRHAIAMGQLRSAQDELQVDLQRDEDELAQLHKDLVQDTENELLTALSATEVSPQEIRTWATDIIRPLSHELAQPSTDITDPAIATTRTARITLSERASAIGAAMRPAPTLALILIVESLALVVASQYESPVIAITHVAFGTLFIAIGMMVVHYAYRPAPQPALNTLVILLALVIVAIISVLGTDLIVRALFPEANAYPVFIATIVIAGLALSAYQAVRKNQSIAEDELANAVGTLIRRREAIAQAMQSSRDRASRFLHDSIQGILYAAALARTPASDVREQVQRAFEEFSEPTASPSPAELRASFDRVVDMWGQALDLKASIDDQAVAIAFNEPAMANKVIDIVSEGLANAAKHGSIGAVRLALHVQARKLVVTITSPGGLQAKNRSGIGTQQLNELTDSWTLISDGTTTRLHVALPRA